MDFFTFADQHPVWTLFYLIVAALGLWGFTPFILRNG